MELKFYAKADLLVCAPEVFLIVGAPHKYIGRKHNPETRSYPAKDSCDSFDSNTKEGRRVAKLIRKDPDCLFPADEETAAFCGVPFVEVAFSDGEWKPVTE